LEERPLLEYLLTPTRLYVNPVLTLLDDGIPVHGMAHITGGGIPENLPRAFGRGTEARLETGSWPEPPVFDSIRRRGVDETEMRGTFNMGIGFCLIVPPEHVAAAAEALTVSGERAYIIGEVAEGERGVWFA
jgi:phosphoribosylformylglycinamidine cyclo-ligase